MIKTIRRWLYEPLVRDVNVDDEALLKIHSRVLKEKPLLRSAFEEFYRDMIATCEKYFPVAGLEIELGSGAGFLKSFRSSVITSDIRSLPSIDRVLDAQKLDLADNSVRCIYAINVFHHLPDPNKFFLELSRVLAPGGGCVLVEPHGGFGSALLHRHLHADENFIPDALTWSNVEIQGPLSGANQALAHIVFTRDIDEFNSLHGKTLKIVSKKYTLNSLRYLFSGGLNFRQLLPSFAGPILSKLEFLGSPFAKYWALHQMIVIKKCQ